MWWEEGGGGNKKGLRTGNYNDDDNNNGPEFTALVELSEFEQVMPLGLGVK